MTYLIFEVLNIMIEGNVFCISDWPRFDAIAYRKRVLNHKPKPSTLHGYIHRQHDQEKKDPTILEYFFPILYKWKDPKSSYIQFKTFKAIRLRKLKKQRMKRIRLGKLRIREELRRIQHRHLRFEKPRKVYHKNPAKFIKNRRKETDAVRCRFKYRQHWKCLTKSLYRR